MKRSIGLRIFIISLVVFVTLQKAGVSATNKLNQVGLQLWSVRQAMQEDFKGTLIQIANAGYDQIEFAGYYDHDPKEIRALLDSLGLTAPAAHTGYDLLSGENLQKTIEAAKIIGHEYLIMPSLPRIQRSQSPDQRQEKHKGSRPYSY